MSLRVGFIAAITCLISLGIFLSGILDGVELAGYDLASRTLGPREPDEAAGQIVMVNVDQRSLDTLSQSLAVNWVWPRQIYAPILDYVAQAEAVFIDILFTEPSSFGNLDDAYLATAVGAAGNIYLPLSLIAAERELDADERAFIDSIAVAGEAGIDRSYRSAVLPIPPLRQAARGTGNVSVAPDDDGVYRRVPLLFQLGDETLPHFVLPYLLERGVASIETGDVHIDGRLLPLVDDTLLLRFYREEKPFQELSAGDILIASQQSDPDLHRDQFAGKYVFIGLTAPGLYDLKPTAVSAVSPGVVVHATALANLLSGTSLTPLGTGYAIGVIAIICLLVSLVVLRSYSLMVNLSLLMVVLTVTVGGLGLLFYSGSYLPFTGPLTALAVSFVLAVAYSYATEGRQRQEIKSAFQHYLAPAVVDRVLDDIVNLKLGGEKKILTALFADIRGFTSLSERFDPEDLVRFLNDYLSVMTQIVVDYAGTVDKYMGDAIMAFYGAPLDQPDHAVRACRTALAMKHRLANLAAQSEGSEVPPLGIGIGINSGPMTVGNMGSNERFDYTIIGDNVNLASRLEGINKEYGTNIVIGELTCELIRESGFTVRKLDRVRVVGKNEPVTIYELLGIGEPDPDTRAFIDSFSAGVQAYRRRDWEQAIVAFQELVQKNDEPSQIYLQRCLECLAAPPPADWDGVYEVTTK